MHEPVDLAEIARHVTAGKVGEVIPGGRRTVGDPVLLERVVQNLVDNAVAYNVPDGTVWVRTRTTGVAGRAGRGEHRPGGPGVRGAEAVRAVPPAPVPDRLGPAAQGWGCRSCGRSRVAHGGRVDARPRDGGGLVVTVTLPTQN